MTTPATEKPAPRIVMPLRISAAGKAVIQRAAKAAGFQHYTAWARAVLAAEATNPKHHVRPKPGE